MLIRKIGKEKRRNDAGYGKGTKDGCKLGGKGRQEASYKGDREKGTGEGWVVVQEGKTRRLRWGREEGWMGRRQARWEVVNVGRWTVIISTLSFSLLSLYCSGEEYMGSVFLSVCLFVRRFVTHFLCPSV